MSDTSVFAPTDDSSMMSDTSVFAPTDDSSMRRSSASEPGGSGICGAARRRDDISPIRSELRPPIAPIAWRSARLLFDERSAARLAETKVPVVPPCDRRKVTMSLAEPGASLRAGEASTFSIVRFADLYFSSFAGRAVKNSMLSGSTTSSSSSTATAVSALPPEAPLPPKFVSCSVSRRLAYADCVDGLRGFIVPAYLSARRYCASSACDHLSGGKETSRPPRTIRSKEPSPAIRILIAVSMDAIIWSIVCGRSESSRTR